MDSETLIDAYNDYKKRELEQTPEDEFTNHETHERFEDVDQILRRIHVII